MSIFLKFQTPLKLDLIPLPIFQNTVSYRNAHFNTFRHIGSWKQFSKKIWKSNLSDVWKSDDYVLQISCNFSHSYIDK